MEIVLASAAGVAAFVLAALVSAVARSHVPGLVLGPLLLVVVLVVARFVGILYALPVGVATVLAFDWYFLPPLRDLDAATVLAPGLFLATSVIVGAFATTTNRRAIASEQARGAIAEEQSALRRVATLVAQAAPPAEVFAAVAEETSTCLGGYCAGGGRQLRVYVDGHLDRGDPTTLTLEPHQELVVAFGTAAKLPSPVPSSYRFPPGL